MASGLEAALPHLAEDGYRITSPSTDDYNCVAWAAGENTDWWEPDRFHQHYWPIRTRNRRVETCAQAFATIGYTPCGLDDTVEAGYEKVAIYADGFIMTHMARQLPDGTWTSKCGKDEDITHHTLHALEDGDYGHVRLILKHPITPSR